MQPRGFIALISVLIISAVLLLLATGGSFSGFYARQNSLGFESKERTQAAANACVSQTLLGLANDSSYQPSGTTTVGGGTCITSPVVPSGVSPNNVYTFRTRSYINTSYTSLKVVAKASDLSVTSVTEIPNY